MRINSMPIAVAAINRELADKLQEEALRDPQSPYRGKYVGIVNGQVVVVTTDMNELGRALRQGTRDPANAFWFEGGRDYSEVHEIWEVC
jgi:hypothetical protein